jgi:succinate dehydrogenase / fumarate reductase membrane anchor subunit
MFWTKRRGVKDFVLQRITAVVLTVYSVLVLGFFLVNGAIDYNSFIEFFGNPAMKIASSVAVLATIGHAWVGLWTIGTDYIQPGHWGLPDNADKIRLGYQFGCVAIMGVYLASALWAIW